MSEGAAASLAQGGPVQGNPTQAGSPPDAAGAETEAEAARAERELGELVKGVEVAAREWGVRPDHLEGRFVSALLAALEWLARLIRAGAADMRVSSRDARAAAEADLARLRAAHEAEFTKLKTANQQAATLLEQARVAVAGSEVQRERVVGRFVEALVPEIAKGVGEAVVIRERRHNRKKQWGTAAGIAAVACGLVLGGYVWGSQGTAEASQGAAAFAVVERVRRCEAAPVKDARTGEAYCPLKALLPPA